MSHRIYTTAGFVIESRPYGEAGKTLSIFTRDLGMVNAAAQGVRLSQSKLRYHAQDFRLSEFSLVRGRDLWRVVGAESVSGTIAAIDLSTSDPATSAAISAIPDPLFVRTLTVLRRLIQGEEKNEALFDAIITMNNFLKKSDGKSDNLAEPIIMLRILHHLGYVRTKPELAPFLADNSFSPELLEKISAPGVKSIAIKEINTALQESHL